MTPLEAVPHPNIEGAWALIDPEEPHVVYPFFFATKERAEAAAEKQNKKARAT